MRIVSSNDFRTIELCIFMKITEIASEKILTGNVFSEPIQVIAYRILGNSVKITGRGLKTGVLRDWILREDQIAELSIIETGTFSGNAYQFRLGIEALRLGLAYEYDPYFSLSIARVDPLPHQLEAVYDFFLKMPRIRALLADDAGAGKTIMAGLLIKELKVRGLIKRILIIAPANLTFQWEREMRDKFRENFEVIRSEGLRSSYGINPWKDKNQVITSLSWVSRIEDARSSLLSSEWDLTIVDESHRMSAYGKDKKTLAYSLGEEISQLTDHFVLLTATPHKGDPENFRRFLALLDRDVYGDVKSLQEAMKKGEAPFYLRRTKEAMVNFPDPTTGITRKLFTERRVETISFEIDAEEYAFYKDLTEYVERQSIRAAAENSIRARAIGFTMALLQRRFASSMYAIRCSLERMKTRRQKMLDNPLPRPTSLKFDLSSIDEKFDDLTEEEQEKVIKETEEYTAYASPDTLRREIREFEILIEQAKSIEKREIESKLRKLKDVLVKQGVFSDPDMKLLIFTEHKDSLDYLVEKIKDWGLTVTQIHGGMPIGNLNVPGTRIFAESEFKKDCQIMVATEAAGEGINLQFCWFMINYDIPWNPVRLEQRMGRIHRYGQTKDCLIFNFVATNTREGRVLHKLLERLTEIRFELGTDHVFDVVGDVFKANELEKLFRDMYANNTSEKAIEKLITDAFDPERFRSIVNSTLEGLAKKELNLSAIVGKKTEAIENRLVPKAIENFFGQAANLLNLEVKEFKSNDGAYRIGKLPRSIYSTAESQESRYGKIAKDYSKIIFDKELIGKYPNAEWVTPGHPLFEALREETLKNVQGDLREGAVFYDINTEKPYFLSVFTASVKDGKENILHRRMYVVQTKDDLITIHQPTIFAELDASNTVNTLPNDLIKPNLEDLESYLIEKELLKFAKEISTDRSRQTDLVSNHVKISFDALIHRQNLKMADLLNAQESSEVETNISSSLKQVEDKIDELNLRMETRISELKIERVCSLTDIQLVGEAIVLPHPERHSPEVMEMVSNSEIERIAVDAVIAYEKSQGREVESVESENRGFDLISRMFHPHDPKTAIDVRFIEVKGRSRIGEVVLTLNEFNTAQQMKKDYWLYVVFNCGTSSPQIEIINDPARLGWEPVKVIERYSVPAKEIFEANK